MNRKSLLALLPLLAGTALLGGCAFLAEQEQEEVQPAPPVICLIANEGIPSELMTESIARGLRQGGRMVTVLRPNALPQACLATVRYDVTVDRSSRKIRTIDFIVEERGRQVLKKSGEASPKGELDFAVVQGYAAALSAEWEKTRSPR